jgi:hypothetical protein
MTLKEAFIAELDEVSVSDATIDKTLIDHGLSGTDSYSISLKEKVDRCVIDCLFRLYTRPDVKEGDFAKSHPDFLRKLEARLLYLAKQYSVAEVLNVLEKAPPTVTNRNVW